MRNIKRLTSTAGVAAVVLASLSSTADATTSVTCNGLEATIVGTPGSETIQGTAGDDVIVGVGGVDLIYGGDGNDTICGGGDDISFLYGDAGNDVLILQVDGEGDGGLGNDTIESTAPGGGTVQFRSTTGPVVVNLTLGSATGPGVGTDRLIGITWVYGTAWDDRLIGSDANESFNPQGGDDLVLAGGGNDVITSENGGRDRLRGQAGVDRMYSDGGGDTYRGGPGRDTMYARSYGADDPHMYGGPGNDLLSVRVGADGDYADGGEGTDLCYMFFHMVNCERT